MVRPVFRWMFLLVFVWLVLGDGTMSLMKDVSFSGHEVMMEGDVCGLDGCGCEKDVCGCDHDESGMDDLGDCVIRAEGCGGLERDVLGFRVHLDYLERALVLLELGDVGVGVFEEGEGLFLFDLVFDLDRPPRIG